MVNQISDKSLRLCYWNAEPRVVDPHRMHLEEVLKILGAIELKTIKSLDDPNLMPSDLIIIAAQAIPEEDFPNWLSGVSQRMSLQGRIWLPALILADSSLNALNEILEQASKMNWYFDIINPDHMSSLPIRVANLLRIHDHLHELGRYEETLDKLQTKVESLTAQLTELRGGG